MDVAKEVRALANWPESGHLVLSLYLNTKWNDVQRREKVRIFVKDRLKEFERDLAGRRALSTAVAADVEFLRDYVDGLVAQHHDVEYDGIAAFCCEPAGLRSVFRSRFPFADEFHAAPRPRIRQLSHLYDEYESAIFADVGTSDAGIYLISAGEADRHVRIENDVPGRHKQGGWSQARFGRRIEDLMDHHHREVADQLVRMADRDDVRNIVLSGTDRVVANFRTFLPKRVDEAVIGVLSLDRNPAPERAVAATVDCLRSAERSREETIVRRVLERRGDPASVAVGLDPVLDALDHGRVHRLLLSTAFDRAGFRCQACGKLGETPPENCELCGEPIVSTDLGEEMVVATIQRGGEVDEIVDRPELEELGGVAALLRY